MNPPSPPPKGLKGAPPSAASPFPPRPRVLGIPVDGGTRRDHLSRARDALRSGAPRMAVTVNALMALDARRVPALRFACETASVAVPDSIGVALAARGQGCVVHRYPGIDFAFDVCRHAAEGGDGVFLLGGQPGVAARAAGHLVARIPGLRICGIRDGVWEPEAEGAVLAALATSRARVVLVALGMPRQEVWIASHLTRLPPALYIGVGGSFDVWAGMVTRAPRWMRAVGLEWAHRLIKEPVRWRRMAQLPVFAWRVAVEKGYNRRSFFSRRYHGKEM